MKKLSLITLCTLLTASSLTPAWYGRGYGWGPGLGWGGPYGYYGGGWGGYGPGIATGAMLGVALSSNNEPKPAEAYTAQAISKQIAAERNNIKNLQTRLKSKSISSDENKSINQQITDANMRIQNLQEKL